MVEEREEPTDEIEEVKRKVAKEKIISLLGKKKNYGSKGKRKKKNIDLPKKQKSTIFLNK